MSWSGWKFSFHVKNFIEREIQLISNRHLACFLVHLLFLIIYLDRIPAMVHVFIYLSELNCVFFYFFLRKSNISVLQKRMNKV